ncbi:hypothetical protein DFH06DRAFT_1466071 [Mycena polygramma]|nr:hypothetical protein DFH06DRAFT_1466071 [Mycena polygramma]
MSLFANINTWDQRRTDICSPSVRTDNGHGLDDGDEENRPPPSTQLFLPLGGQPRPSVGYGSSFSSPSVPGTQLAGGFGHGGNHSVGHGSFTGSTGLDFGDGSAHGSTILGRRQRQESMTEWSPPTKVRLKTYANDVASEYGVPESSLPEFLDACQLPTHKLLIVTLGAVLGQRNDASSDSRLAEYLGSSEFKENVITQIRGLLLDPKLPSYKVGFLDRLMRHIRLNPGLYHIPQEFRAMITTKAFNSAVSRAAVGARSEIKRKMSTMWGTKSSIYQVVKSLACKSSQEMTDAIWARMAWVQMKLVDYKAANPGQDGFWDFVDNDLFEYREETLTKPLSERAAHASYVFEESLKFHLMTCPPKRKQKGSQRLPKWQEDISRAIDEMDSYTQDDLAEEVPEDGQESP